MRNLSKRIRKRIILSIILMLIFSLLVITLFPIAFMIGTSFKSMKEIQTGGPNLFPSVLHLKRTSLTDLFGESVSWLPSALTDREFLFPTNYIDMWVNINFFTYLKNSLIICTSVAIIALIFATLAGYALGRFRFPGATVFGTSVLATQMIPGIMFLIPLYIIFVKLQNDLGFQMVNTYRGMIITYVAFFIPFSIWIMRGFFAAIPKDLEEAGMIDGCTYFQAFYRIILPLAAPGLVATGIYIFLTAWDELLFAWVLTTTSKVQTIPVGIRLYVGNYQNRYDLLMAAATVSTLPVTVLFLLVQRWLIAGLTAGAVKG